MKAKLDRFLRKTFGDKRGGVMMEYVILAVLIAAAVVVAVAMFGKTLVGMFDVGAKGATGRHTDAQSTLGTVRGEQDASAQDARDYHDDMHE